ncbi:MAG: hypothetical protein ACOYN0_04590 [Phycisphaerales bacterium]
MNRLRFAVILAAGCVPTAVACADNPLVIQGALAPTDAIAIGYDGPNAPGPSTFYYDLYTFTVSMTGVYTFSMEAPGPGLAPWLGVYANNFTPVDYLSPLPIDIVAAPPGTTISMDLNLTAGTYQALASTADWIEEANALDEGDYTLTMSGPVGAEINLVPSPGVGAVGLLALAARRRRR